MISLRKSSILLLLIALSACDVNSATSRKKMPECLTKEECLTDPDCLCWCSVKCGYRKKTAEDKPIYIENDPKGKFCYCKQWDLDYYDDNCEQGKGVEQPAGAK